MADVADKEFEDFLKSRETGMPRKLPGGPNTRTLVGESALRSSAFPIVRADISKAMAPRLAEADADNVDEDFENFIAANSNKRRKARVVPVQNQLQLKGIIGRGQTEEDEFEALLTGAKTGFRTGLDKPDIGHQIAGKLTEALGSDTAQAVFTALGIDEHLIVKGLSTVVGDPEKPNIGDYTWGNFLIARGAPDSTTTTVLGLAMSIGLTPSTYLTFGIGPTAKLAGLGGKLSKVTLTKRGRRLVNEVVKSSGDAAVNVASKKAKKILDASTANKVRQASKLDIEKQVLKMFGDVDEFNKAAIVGREVKELGKKSGVISKGGARLEIPFTGREIPLTRFNPFRASDIDVFGKNLVRGETVAQIAHKTGLTKLTRAIEETKAFKKAVDYKNAFGSRFVPQFGVNKSLVRAIREAGPEADTLLKSERVTKLGQAEVDLAHMSAIWEETLEKSEDLKRLSVKQADEFFSAMTPKQKKDFMDSAIDASLEEKKIFVKAKTGDAVVQRRLDLWYGQGDFAGTRSVPDELAEKSRLLELDNKQLSNWVPGIVEQTDPSALKLNKVFSPADREFLKERVGDPFLALNSS